MTAPVARSMLVPVQVTVAPVDSTDEDALRQCFDIRVAAHMVDHPAFPPAPWAEVRSDHQAPPAGSRVFHAVARDQGGAPVGCSQLRLSDESDLDLGLVEIHVIPTARRQGIGGALLAALRGHAREERRTRLIADIAEPLEGDAASPGAAFAEAVGARRVLDEVRRLLVIPEVSSDAADGGLTALREEAARRAAGYRLVQWVGDTPEDLKAGWAALHARMRLEAPLGQLELEQEEWDAERVTRLDATNRARGRERIATAAIHEASGQMVGYTDIGRSIYGDETAYQWETLVLPEHRGHRLGLLLKLANLDLLRRHSPRTRFVHTVNAAVNSHMVAINDLVGFKPVERCSAWELDLR